MIRAEDQQYLELHRFPTPAVAYVNNDRPQVNLPHSNTSFASPPKFSTASVLILPNMQDSSSLACGHLCEHRLLSFTLIVNSVNHLHIIQQIVFPSV